MCIYRVRFASGSSKNKVKKRGFITVYLQSMGLVRGNHQDISKHSWVSIPFVKIYPNHRTFRKRALSGHIWTM